MPVDFKVEAGNAGVDCFEGGAKGKEDVKRKEGELGSRRGGLGFKKKMRAAQPGDLPYVEAVEEKAAGCTLASPRSALTSPRSAMTSPRSRKEAEWDDNIGYFIKKVIDFPKKL